MADTTTTPTATQDRTNVTDQGYTYNGTDYKYETRTDANGGSYKVDVAQPKAAVTSTADGTSALTSTGLAGTVYSSSAPVVAQENATAKLVNGLSTDNTATTQAHNDYLTQIQTQMDALEQRRIREEAGINASFDSKAQQQKQAQAGETGTYTSTLARIGGYLGDSASASGALVNLATQHQYEINDLEAKRQSALNEARNAITDKQFALAQSKAQEAKDYAKEINDRKDKFFSQSLQAIQESRQQDEFQRTKMKDDLATLSTLEPSKIDPKKLTEIDQYYGTPGFAKNYIDVTNAAKVAKNQKDMIETKKAMVDLLQTLPAGKTVSFPDGSSYTGMGKSSDISTFMQTDSNGVGHLITYNKGNGKTSVQSVGVVGKSSGGGSGLPKTKIPEPAKQAVYSTFQKQLNNTMLKTSSGNSYNPETYVTLRDNLLNSSMAALVPDMDARYLNPKNSYFTPDGIAQLRKRGLFYGDTIDAQMTGEETNDINANDAETAQEGQ